TTAGSCAGMELVETMKANAAITAEMMSRMPVRKAFSSANCKPAEKIPVNYATEREPNKPGSGGLTAGQALVRACIRGLSRSASCCDLRYRRSGIARLRDPCKRHKTTRACRVDPLFP